MKLLVTLACLGLASHASSYDMKEDCKNLSSMKGMSKCMVSLLKENKKDGKMMDIMSKEMKNMYAKLEEKSQPSIINVSGDYHESCDKDVEDDPISTFLSTAEFEVKPEKLSEFLPWLQEKVLKDARAFEGCISIDTHVELSTANVLLVEKWESEQAYRDYLESSFDIGLIALLKPFLEEEFIFREFDLKEDV